MATEDVLSGYITNRDAVPITHTTGAQAGGMIDPGMMGGFGGMIPGMGGGGRGWGGGGGGNGG